ncbi:MAG TPA: phosphate regulon transcriptional regulatory protein PhoB [Gammaproteobacteria bacterium]|nr:phosphate regulon transcriptional regulatory protein PhoB [Gammaproteobacteria bacterium]
MSQILIVEDEAAIREMLQFSLVKAGFQCQLAADAEQALVAISARPPDLLLLDWMLPGMSGIDLARRLRGDELTRNLPIIMLTARGEEDDRVLGLECGADDYVAKPFSPRELLARIRALLRRTAPPEDAVLEAGRLVLDLAAHRVRVGGQEVELAPAEFRLLSFFMAHPERVFSRGQLLDQVWGRGVFIEERTVDVHIRRLRKSLSGEGCDTCIQTVRGAGYRFSTRTDT